MTVCAETDRRKKAEDRKRTEETRLDEIKDGKRGDGLGAFRLHTSL